MKKDYRYLAGIIDGEGCISINLYNKQASKYNLRVRVDNTSKELIFWIAENFGGKVRFQKSYHRNYRDIWRWEINYKNLEKLIKKILPYLIIKKEQAKLALKYRKTVNYRGKRCVPEKILEQRKELYLLMKQLNKRGTE
ncbi:hypothetical protein KAR91_43760 [Candidatus Pacearchaeota archaeon]|nr:hypothetical protein [Candidatus Pacearchaeota archaeon]